MKNILYVNACVKREVASRTGRLAQAYLKKSLETESCKLSTVNLEDTVIQPLTGKSLAEREKAIANNDFPVLLLSLSEILPWRMKLLLPLRTGI